MPTLLSLSISLSIYLFFFTCLLVYKCSFVASSPPLLKTTSYILLMFLFVYICFYTVCLSTFIYLFDKLTLFLSFPLLSSFFPLLCLIYLSLSFLPSYSPILPFLFFLFLYSFLSLFSLSPSFFASLSSIIHSFLSLSSHSSLLSLLFPSFFLFISIFHLASIVRPSTVNHYHKTTMAVFITLLYLTTSLSLYLLYITVKRKAVGYFIQSLYYFILPDRATA